MGDMAEVTISEDVIANQTLILEVQNNFICTPRCYGQKVPSTKITYLANRYYEHDFSSSMKDTSQKMWLIKITQETNDENRYNDVNDDKALKKNDEIWSELKSDDTNKLVSVIRT